MKPQRDAEPTGLGPNVVSVVVSVNHDLRRGDTDGDSERLSRSRRQAGSGDPMAPTLGPIGIRNRLRIEVLKERYADNFPNSAFVAHMRADVQLALPKSFGRLIGITP